MMHQEGLSSGIAVGVGSAGEFAMFGHEHAEARGATALASEAGRGLAVRTNRESPVEQEHSAVADRPCVTRRDVGVRRTLRLSGPEFAVEILDTWIRTSFEGGRHQRRIDLISDYESRSRSVT